LTKLNIDENEITKEEKLDTINTIMEDRLNDLNNAEQNGIKQYFLDRIHPETNRLNVPLKSLFSLFENRHYKLLEDLIPHAPRIIVFVIHQTKTLLDLSRERGLHSLSASIESLTTTKRIKSAQI